MSGPRSKAPLHHYDEIVVYDGLEPCPYIAGNTARMPLRLQLRHDGSRYDSLLAGGDRRVGQMLYRPSCPSCSACVDIRIPTSAFKPTRSQRRILSKNADLQVLEGRPAITRERLGLFNRHKLERGLGTHRLDAEAYAGWLVRSCADTWELAYYAEGELVAVSIIDLGESSSSAVYCYFTPDHSKRSLGTFAILHGIEWARARGAQYHYLGLWVGENPHLSYKTKFFPHERLEGGLWTRYGREGRL